MGKIISTAQIKDLSDSLKREYKKIVLAGGCFDIIHIGHISFLEKAKKSGDILILLLESDKSIKKLKGEKRPLNSQKNRAVVLSALENVDYIIPLEKIYQSSDYNSLVLTIKPDVIAVTSGDPHLEDKKMQAKSAGGKVKVVLKKLPEHSTTKLLDYF